jgi:hypothetical protein
MIPKVTRASKRRASLAPLAPPAATLLSMGMSSTGADEQAAGSGDVFVFGQTSTVGAVVAKSSRGRRKKVAALAPLPEQAPLPEASLPEAPQPEAPLPTAAAPPPVREDL